MDNDNDCRWCGKRIDYDRFSHVEFCNIKCSNAYHNFSRKMKRKADRIRECLSDLSDMKDDKPKFAGRVLRIFDNVSIEAKLKMGVYTYGCRNCGQRQFVDPEGAACDFCGATDWFFSVMGKSKSPKY